MTKNFRNRRQLRRVGLATVIVVLGVGVWQGVAGATATGPKTRVIQNHNANCGRHISSEAIGTATFSRDGFGIFVDVVLTHAEKNALYLVELWKATGGGDCQFITDMGELGTDGAGQGSGSFEAEVGQKKHNYFIDVVLGESRGGALTRGPQASSVDNDSLIAHL